MHSGSLKLMLCTIFSIFFYKITPIKLGMFNAKIYYCALNSAASRNESNNATSPVSDKLQGPP
jgi:hypothetical protein